MAKVNTKVQEKNRNKAAFIGIGVVILGVVLVFIIKSGLGGKDTLVPSGGNLVISKSEVTSTAKFYQYKAGNTKMEVLAVLAPDGTVRTAFNTCQVCYDSGRGYYEQEGDELVCQNCGNRFNISQIEVIKGGCNPVPILSENKTEDGANITISEEFLAQNKGLFGNWGKK